MIIQEAIDRAQAIRSDDLPVETKVRWLSSLDGRLYREVILQHEKPDVTEFVPYSPDDTSGSLLVPFPYDELYVHYLLAKRDEAYGEADLYNNDASMFNEEESQWRREYHRTHMPLRVR